MVDEHRPRRVEERSRSSSRRTSPRRRRARRRRGDGTSQASLLDDDEATVWNSTGAPVAGRQVVVDLAGTAPVTLRWANVSAMLTPGEQPLHGAPLVLALRLHRRQGPGEPDVQRRDRGRLEEAPASRTDDAFPSVNPRPMVPNMTLRGWQLPSTTGDAREVRRPRRTSAPARPPTRATRTTTRPTTPTAAPHRRLARDRGARGRAPAVHEPGRGSRRGRRERRHVGRTAESRCYKGPMDVPRVVRRALAVSVPVAALVVVISALAGPPRTITQAQSGKTYRLAQGGHDRAPSLGALGLDGTAGEHARDRTDPGVVLRRSGLQRVDGESARQRNRDDPIHGHTDVRPLRPRREEPARHDRRSLTRTRSRVELLEGNPRRGAGAVKRGGLENR